MNRFGATVSWEPPKFDGGSEITAYVIELRDRTSVKWEAAMVCAASDRSTTLNDVVENKEYIFRVRAENKAGIGRPSAATNPVKIMDPIGESKPAVIFPGQFCVRFRRPVGFMPLTFTYWWAALMSDKYISAQIPNNTLLMYISCTCREAKPTSEPELQRPNQHSSHTHLGDTHQQRWQHDHWLHY